MKQTIGVYEAKKRLSQLLDEVADGDRVIATPNGTPVGEFRAVESEHQSPDDLVRQFKAFQCGQRRCRGSLLRTGETLRELAHEGS